MAQSEIRLSSKDLEILLNQGGLNFDQIDLLQLDPSVASQLVQFKHMDTSTTVASDPNLNSAANRPQRPKPMSIQRQPTRGTQVQGPYVEIVEQPKARGLRFRYECEGRSAGSIPGENSTPERKTFPTIKIHNYQGPAVIVVSCVTRDEPYKPHPHNLVGKDCKKGVCTLRIRDTNTISFPHLGIQCAKKKDVDGNLKMRQEINVDPYQTGFKHKGTNIDLNVVRLCFQVFLPDDTGKITRIVPPVVSQLIHDRKALNDLVICRVDRTSGKPRGGDEVFLLCEKINRDDVRVRFYEERDGNVVWEAFGDFGQNDVHRQYAIVFKTPAYREQYLTQPVEVSMQLQRTSDSEGSDAISFTYQPEDPDPDRILEKRKRKAATLSFLQDTGNSNISQETLKQRLKLKATRTTNRSGIKTEPNPMVKDEAMNQDLPQYSFTNTGSMKTPADMSSALHVAPAVDQFSVSSQAEIASTMASSMSGGKVQYTPSTSQANLPIQNINVTQLIQLLQAGVLSTQQQPSQSNQPMQQQQQTGLQSNQPFEGNAQVEMLKRYLMQQANLQQNPTLGSDNPVITNNDPNLNQETVSLGSLDPFLQSLITSDSPMQSFESFDLSGLGNVDGDQNVAMFEVVGENSSSQPQQGQQQQPQMQQFDETNTAVQNLN